MKPIFTGFTNISSIIPHSEWNLDHGAKSALLALPQDMQQVETLGSLGICWGVIQGSNFQSVGGRSFNSEFRTFEYLKTFQDLKEFNELKRFLVSSSTKWYVDFNVWSQKRRYQKLWYIYIDDIQWFVCPRCWIYQSLVCYSHRWPPHGSTTQGIMEKIIRSHVT